MQSLDGTIVECNTAYGGQRANTAMHYQLAKDHGYTDIADVDIMDEEGSMNLAGKGGSMWSAEQDPFLESMAEAGKSVVDALDQACIDLVYAAEDGQSLIKRIESRNGLHTLEHAEEIGLGSREYRLENIDD